MARLLLGTSHCCIHCQEYSHCSPTLSAGLVSQSWPWQQLNETQKQSRPYVMGNSVFFLCDVIFFLVKHELTIKVVCCFFPKCFFLHPNCNSLSRLSKPNLELSLRSLWCTFCCIENVYIFLNSVCIFPSFKEASEEEH